MPTIDEHWPNPRPKFGCHTNLVCSALIPLPIIKILGIAKGIIPELLGDRQLPRPNDLPKLRSDLVEQVPPTPPVMGTQHCRLLFVHLQIAGEVGLPGHDPRPPPRPPLPQ